MQLFVKCPLVTSTGVYCNGPIALEVNSTDTIGEVKTMIQERGGLKVEVQQLTFLVLITPLMYRVYQILVTIGYILCPIGTSGSFSASAYASNFMICPVPVVDLSWTGLFPCDLGWRGSALVVAIVSVVFLVSYLFIKACLTRWNPQRVIKQIVNCTPKENKRKRDKFDVSLVSSILTPALSFSLVVFSRHLLLQCGDVESNPGPGNIGYERMVSCAVKIVECFCRDPQGIALFLFSKRLISDSILSETMELNITKVDKARRLYPVVLQVVKLHPERYNDFVAIFRDQVMYMDLLEILEINERSEATTESATGEKVVVKRDGHNAMNQWIFSTFYKTVQELLWPARSEWYNFGIVLEVDKNTLKSIQKTHRSNCDDCFNDMLKSCSEMNTSITWTGVCEALRRPTVGRNDVAENIEAMVPTLPTRPGLCSDGYDSHRPLSENTRLHMLMPSPPRLVEPVVSRAPLPGASPYLPPSQAAPTSQHERRPIPQRWRPPPHQLATPLSPAVYRAADQYPPNTFPPAQLPELPEPVYSPHAPHYQEPSREPYLPPQQDIAPTSQQERRLIPKPRRRSPLPQQGPLAQLPEPVYSPHYQESSPEYKTMLSCTPQLNDIIALDPQRIYDEMIAAFNQSVHIREFIRHPTHTDRAKATKLVVFMTDQIKTSPSDFDKFMAILKRLSWTERIVGLLLTRLASNRRQ